MSSLTVEQNDTPWIERQRLTPDMFAILFLGEAFAVILHPTAMIAPILMGYEFNSLIVYFIVVILANAELIYDFIFWRILVGKMQLGKTDVSEDSHIAKKILPFFIRKYKRLNSRRNKTMKFIKIGGVPALFFITIPPILGGRLTAVFFVALTKSWKLLGVVLLGNAIHVAGIIFAWSLFL